MKKVMQYIIMLIVFLMSIDIIYAQTESSVIENQVLSAVAKYNEGDLEGAKSLLADVYGKDPDNDTACYYLAMVAIREAELEIAEFFLREAVELDGSNYWYRHRLATLYSVTNRPELAIAIYEQLLKDFPKKSDLYQELVELYAAQNEYDKALSTIDEIEKVVGQTETLAVYRYNLLRLSEKTQEAYESLEKYNEKYSSPYVLCTLADWQLSMYKDSTAMAYYDEALELDSEYYPAQLGRAEVMRMRRDYDSFFPALNSFIINPSTPVGSKVEYIKAVVNNSAPQFLEFFRSKIDTVMTSLTDTHPSDSLALEMSGLWYFTTSRNDEAMELFQRNAQLHPSSLTASASLVEFLMYAEKWKELSDEGRKAFAAFPKEPAFLELASVGDYNLGKYDKVLELCNQVLEVAPGDSSKTLRAWSTIGDIYHQKGENKKAYKAYDKALKINPDYIYVLNNYAYYLSEEGKKLKKAYDMSKKTIEAEPDNATYLDTFGWIIYLMGRPVEAKPFFKRAMLYGGKESAVILDHYADVLYDLKEYDLAFVYWTLAKQKNVDGELKGLDEKVKQKKAAVKK